MSLLKIIKNPVRSFDFTTYPVRVGALNTTTINYSALSDGLAVGNTGNRIWDSSVLAPSGTYILNSSTSLTFPLVNTYIPNQEFDAIINLIIDGKRYPQGYSSSPDNYSSTAQNINPSVDKIIYWSNLNCFGQFNNTGISSTLNNYMFGGTGRQVGAGVPLYIHFSQPTVDNLSVYYKISLTNYIYGYSGFIDGTVNVPVNTLDFLLFGGLLSPPTFSRGYEAGYFTVELDVNNTNYQSLLNYYHWGIA